MIFKLKKRIFDSYVYGKIIRIRIIRTDTAYITAKIGNRKRRMAKMETENGQKDAGNDDRENVDYMKVNGCDNWMMN